MAQCSHIVSEPQQPAGSIFPGLAHIYLSLFHHSQGPEDTCLDDVFELEIGGQIYLFLCLSVCWREEV